MRNSFLLLTAALAYVILTNMFWIAWDTRPPFWDMAHHQSRALQVLDAFSATGISALRAVPAITDAYPPLYHFIVAFFYAVFGRSTDAAQYANLPAIAIILFSTFGIARRLLSPLPAAAAAALAVSFPYMLWISRETVIESWQTAMVTLSIWYLVRTGLVRPAHALLFGMIAGLGMLTKPTFVLFVALPALWVVRRNWRSAAVAAAAGLVVSSYWYVGQLRSLLAYWNLVSNYAEFEGDPQRFTLQSFVFYIRALEGYQLFLPLFVLFVAGIVFLLRKPDPKWFPVALWILGGWGGLLFFQNKDPRFTAPLLPGVAIVCAVALDKRPRLISALVPLIVFQHYLVSFGIPWLPQEVVLARGHSGAQITWNWNLYTQTYFGLWGPPAREDWHIEGILNQITRQRSRAPGAPVRLGLVPDIPRFDLQAWEFHAALGRLPVEVERLSELDVPALLQKDYILLSENGQGYAEYGSGEWRRINAYILENPQTFPVVQTFALPTGDTIRLCEVSPAE